MALLTSFLCCWKYWFIMVWCRNPSQSGTDSCCFRSSSLHRWISKVAMAHNLNARYYSFKIKMTNGICFSTIVHEVFSRVWTLWAVMDVAPPAQNSIFTLLACASWSLVEVPRYLFYALNLLNAVPYPLFWLRYRFYVAE